MPEDYRLVTALFFKGLALIYLAAFFPIALEIEGLAGSQGVLPLIEHQTELRAEFGNWRFVMSPSLFWLNASDWTLIAAARAGIICALLLLLGVWPRLMLIVLYVLYLSLYHAGSLFMNFQWETLLLEAGFLAIFLAGGGSRLVIWLMRWLLFRLRFLSGISKLTSGDPSWAGLAALNTYFETQPLPHAGAYYAHHLPDWVLRAGTAGTLAIEILVPFLFLAPRRYRMTGAALTIVLQLLIIATSNHNFINLLTILLCLFLFDDKALLRFLPEFPAGLGPRLRTPGIFQKAMLTIFAPLILFTSTLQIFWMTTGLTPPNWAVRHERQVMAFALSNRYHIFPVMDTQRLELIVEWSMDAQNWKPVPFKYKPGDPNLAPRFIIPYHPRLDWVLWFVPKNAPPFFYTYQRFLERLLAGSKPVLALLPEGTFKNGPPRYLRAHIAKYRFAAPEIRSRTGKWWEVEYYSPFWPMPFMKR